MTGAIAGDKASRSMTHLAGRVDRVTRVRIGQTGSQVSLSEQELAGVACGLIREKESATSRIHPVSVVYSGSFPQQNPHGSGGID